MLFTITVALVCLATVVWASYWIVESVIASDKTKQEWYDGKGKPTTVEVAAGTQATLPALNMHVSQHWPRCRTSCRRPELNRYARVFPIGDFRLTKGCFTAEPREPVLSIMAGATRANAYSLAVSSNGKVVTVCSIGAPHDDDKLVFHLE